MGNNTSSQITVTVVSKTEAHTGSGMSIDFSWPERFAQLNEKYEAKNFLPSMADALRQFLTERQQRIEDIEAEYRRAEQEIDRTIAKKFAAGKAASVATSSAKRGRPRKTDRPVKTESADPAPGRDVEADLLSGSLLFSGETGKSGNIQ